MSAAGIKRYADILGVTINHILGDDNTQVPRAVGPSYKHLWLGETLDEIERRNPEVYRALRSLIRRLAGAADS